MPRKRRRGTRYLDEHEIRARVGLDNAARSTSTALHNRRKPGLLSTGTPEIVDLAVTTGKLASNLNGINAKVPNQEFTKDKVSTNGRWVKDDQHADTAYKNDIVTKAKDLGYGDGSKYIPDGALAQDYARASSITSINQTIKGLQNKVKNLSQKIKKLEQGRKKG